ncbi:MULTISPECIES: alpha/beta fold hydrolase [unclassified Marinobacterium]|uniref:alpha/beta fold hydrolase n=1 Tax=unclassified Marinobacterium TaxID=2644139 RepID=UPI0019F625C5|nr:Proline iminopeptidase [Marinobacterium sp. xm-g-48]NRP46783.1 Proline iminopeptidase [Marinobacterium sp. xm-d-543]NRP83633.1 Proline iminopeptidase [Marinobacterium sp. xm-d-509]NRQ01970.1 Proline iminopeptidase [Marinobacterium sp. xm-d-530]NRQ23340.1 Proline iminopeptidase [Marinobacterium sp. xm-m-312]
MEKQVTTDQGLVSIKIWGAELYPEIAPLVLMHDSLGSVNLWREFPEQLLERLQRPIIAYDRLGFGNSDSRAVLPNLDFIAEEAKHYFPQIKTALGFKEYLVLGHSVGGAMAVEIGASDPDCLAVITIAAQAFVEKQTLKSISEAKLLFTQDGQLEKLERWHGANARWVLSAWTDVWLNPDFAEWRLTDALNELKSPVLAIHGELDEYGSQAFPQYIHDQSAGPSDQVIIPDCAHVPHRTNAEQVLESIEQFLKTNLVTDQQ